MRPQLREGDDAFVAVERYSGGNGRCCICRGGQEKVMYGFNFPDTVGEVNEKRLVDQEFLCPVWREGDCSAGAGEGEGGGAAAFARV